MLERAFEKEGLKLEDSALAAALPRLAQNDLQDTLAAVGRGEVPPVDVIKAMFPDHQAETPKRQARTRILRRRKPADGPAIPIRGIEGDFAPRYAPEGGAVPGDRIVGILSPGEGVTIYPIQAPALKDFEDTPERWLDVRWDIDERTPQRFPARVFVQSANEPGSLAQIAQVIAEHDGNIDNVRMTRRSPDFTEMLIDLEVYDLKHLTAIIAQIRAKKMVAKAERVNG
jgi:(p)ppGpp synthase/HD superfamily hydrolase